MRTGESSPSHSRPLRALNRAGGFRRRPCPLTPAWSNSACFVDQRASEGTAFPPLNEALMNGHSPLLIDKGRSGSA